MLTISAGSRQPSGNNLSLENSLATQGNAPIFVDAVHAHLDNQHPFKSAPSTLKKLNQFIAKTLGYDLSSNRAARGGKKIFQHRTGTGAGIRGALAQQSKSNAHAL